MTHEYTFRAILSFQKEELGFVLSLFQRKGSNVFYTPEMDCSGLVTSFNRLNPREEDIILLENTKIIKNDIEILTRDKLSLEEGSVGFYCFLAKSKSSTYRLYVDQQNELRNRWLDRADRWKESSNERLDLFTKLNTSRLLRAHRLVKLYKNKIKNLYNFEENDYLHDQDCFETIFNPDENSVNTFISLTKQLIKSIQTFHFIIIDQGRVFDKGSIVLENMKFNLMGLLDVIKLNNRQDAVDSLSSIVFSEFSGHTIINLQSAQYGTLTDWIKLHEDILIERYHDFYVRLIEAVDTTQGRSLQTNIFREFKPVKHQRDSANIRKDIAILHEFKSKLSDV